jgi:hypothetical protein
VKFDELSGPPDQGHKRRLPFRLDLGLWSNGIELARCRRNRDTRPQATHDAQALVWVAQVERQPEVGSIATEARKLETRRHDTDHSVVRVSQRDRAAENGVGAAVSLLPQAFGDEHDQRLICDL